MEGTKNTKKKVLLHVYNTGDVEPLFAGSYCSEYFMLTVINLLDQ